MFTKKAPKEIPLKELPLIKRLKVNETMQELLALTDDPSFRVKYELADDCKGYLFLFPDYTKASIIFNTSFQDSNIHETKNVFDNNVSLTSWSRKFYFWVKVIQNYKFSQDNGLDIEVAYQLAKKCCAKFNITLDESLDSKLPNRGLFPEVKPEESIEEELELDEDEDKEETPEKETKSRAEVREQALVLIDLKIKRDLEFLKAFEEEFKVNSLIVIETFEDLLRDCPCEELIEDIRSIWDRLKQKDDDSILFNLSLVRSYVIGLLRQKSRIHWQTIKTSK